MGLSLGLVQAAGCFVCVFGFPGWYLAEFLVGGEAVQHGGELTPSAMLLIAVRSVQDMSAGVLVAAGQTVSGLAVGPERLGRMMGVLGLVVGLAPIVGPSVGGFLLAHFSWPMLFWLNVPIGAIAITLGLKFVPRGERQPPPRMDWPGFVLVSVGLPLVVYGLTELGTPGLLADVSACITPTVA